MLQSATPAERTRFFDPEASVEGALIIAPAKIQCGAIALARLHSEIQRPLTMGDPQAIRIRPRNYGGIDSSSDAPGRTSNALLVVKPPAGSRSTGLPCAVAGGEANHPQDNGILVLGGWHVAHRELGQADFIATRQRERSNRRL